MRWILIVLTAVISTAVRAQEVYVEILGVKVERSMPKADVLAAFPRMHCLEVRDDIAPGHHSCSISDGIHPGVDGEITFREGRVHRASRNWFIPEDATPFDVLVMQNELLNRLAGESKAVCAKIESHMESWTENHHQPGTIQFAFPEKVLVVFMHSLRDEIALFRESTRVNPVPVQHKVRGKKMQGTEWCAYVN